VPRSVWEDCNSLLGIPDLLVRETFPSPNQSSNRQDNSRQFFELLIFNTNLSLYQTFLFCERDIESGSLSLSNIRHPSQVLQSQRLAESFVELNKAEEIPRKAFRGRYVPGEDVYVNSKISSREGHFSRPGMSMQQAYNQLVDLRLPVGQINTAPQLVLSKREVLPNIEFLAASLRHSLIEGAKSGQIGQTL
jgi:hypothetical protein